MIYAVISENGVGVFNSWERAKHELIYLKGFRHSKKFPTYYEANEYALAHLAIIAKGKRLPYDLSLNNIFKVDMLDPLILPFRIKEE